MQKSFSNFRIKPSILFLILAMLIGGYIRLAAVLKSAYPINDGGLFYTMTRDLAANNWKIPAFTSYNHLDIPFAYPPLGFYLTGLLSQLAGWELLDIIRILPAVISLLTIPAFFIFATNFLKDEYKLGFATLIFALVPPSFTWLIMGGGITRSLAFFLSILTLSCIYHLYTTRRNRNIFLTAILASLTILSHPETALHTAIGALILFLFLERNKTGFRKSIMVLALILVITSPWWVTVIIYHGFSPFLAAGQTGWYSYDSIIDLLTFDLSYENGLQTIGVLSLIGIFWNLSKKRFILPIWFFLLYLCDPRNAPQDLAPLMAILSSTVLIEILSVLSKHRSKEESFMKTPLDHPISKVFLAVLICQWVISSMATMIYVGNQTILTQEENQAVEWVKNNTVPNSHFIILSGKSSLMDPVSEWFPALTDRKSVNTVQGREWLDDNNFGRLLESSDEAQDCINQTPECIFNWASKNQEQINYIFLSKVPQQCDNDQIYASGLYQLLQNNSMFKEVYTTKEISIFQID